MATTTPTFLSRLLVLTVLTTGTSPVLGDQLDNARHLLEITDAGKWFELAARMQTDEIIKTYNVIVSTSTDTALPESVINQITLCYQRTYAWENYASGFAQIFAENMSSTDLSLLIDFFSDKSVPPNQISRFKELRDKAEVIEQLSINYMSEKSEGCDGQNVALILAYLAGHNV